MNAKTAISILEIVGGVAACTVSAVGVTIGVIGLANPEARAATEAGKKAFGMGLGEGLGKSAEKCVKMITDFGK